MARKRSRKTTRTVKAETVPEKPASAMEFIVKFLAAITGAYMESTQKQYEYCLQKFANWLIGKQLDPLDVSLNELEEYRNQLTGGSANKNVSIYAIRSFYKWLVQHGHLAASPAQTLPGFSKSAKIDEIPTVEDVKASLEQFKYPWKMLVGIQALAGARMEGAMNLRMSDIDWENRKITIREKAKKGSKEKQERTVKVPEALLELIKDYLRYRPEPSIPAIKDFLVLDKIGRKLYNPNQIRNYQRYLHKHTERICGRKFRSHSFRKFFGKDLYKHGIEVATISKLLGHKQVQTTMTYIQVDSDDMEKAVENGSSFRLEEKEREELIRLRTEKDKLAEEISSLRERLSGLLTLLQPAE
ncbi:MAG: tyrosine-type recombinase/integrase [Candidatus Heimdallarchaeota archaeon]